MTTLNLENAQPPEPIQPPLLNTKRKREDSLDNHSSQIRSEDTVNHGDIRDHAQLNQTINDICKALKQYAYSTIKHGQSSELTLKQI